jgi:hypothetical protein
LRKYKLPGGDQIPAWGNTLQVEIHKFIRSVWNKEELPDQLKASVIITIYKKMIKL